MLMARFNEDRKFQASIHGAKFEDEEREYLNSEQMQNYLERFVE